MNKSPWQDQHWTSADGLKLHYRDYAGPAGVPPILCIPGLTRNARDFEPVADAFAGQYRLICVDLRGRGDSGYSRDSASYTAENYVADIIALLDELALERVAAIGTSLGGILTMMLAAQQPQRLAGAVLNDIGPHIEQAGLDRIAEYVGQGRSFPTWMHAARNLAEQAGDAYPDYELSDWLRHAKRLMYVGPHGRISYDYDMKIADLFDAEPQPAGDLWPAFRALAGRPVLALRGELSDILSAETLNRMQQDLPEMEAVTVPRTGHVPTLAEPQAQAAIARLLAQVAGA